MSEKQALRRRLRGLRRDHVAALPESTRALLFRRPPAVIEALIPKGATIGLYHPLPGEAPTGALARWFAEAGHRLALPWFADSGAAMQFRAWPDPWTDEGLTIGPFGALQPGSDVPQAVPEAVFVPLLGFTDDGARLGQGGGHYDRWLAEHPGVFAVGLAWDVQFCDDLPRERHDRPLSAVITPTRVFGPWSEAR